MDVENQSGKSEINVENFREGKLGEKEKSQVEILGEKWKIRERNIGRKGGNQE